jgi:hypothetical protein
MKTILDPSFKYTPSCQTDVRKTFDRIRREQQARIDRAVPVTQLVRRRAAPPPAS